MHKFIQCYLPISFSNTWTLNEDRRVNYNVVLHNNADLYVPFARLTSSFRQPFINLPKTWENFTNYNVKILRVTNQFNKALKNHFIDDLSEIIQCNRLLCPSCHLPQN